MTEILVCPQTHSMLPSSLAYNSSTVDKISFLLFILIAVSSPGDFIMDWLFYKEVSALKTGLVYGENDPVLVKSLLAFSAIGSAAFVAEMIFLPTRKLASHAHIDILWLVAVWLEDIPKAVIGLHLAVCHEETSTIQLTKASFALAQICIRCLATLFRVWRKYVFAHFKGIKFVEVAGSVIAFACTVAVLSLNHPKPGGEFHPPVVWEGETFGDSPHFRNVSVFVNFARYFDAGNLDACKQDAVVNWVRLASATSIRASPPHRQASYSFRFEPNGADSLKMAVWEKTASTWSSPKCFLTHLTSGTVTQEVNSTCGSKGYLGNSSTEVFVKFRFDPPSGSVFKNRIFGQIFFNVKVLENGICQDAGNHFDGASQVSGVHGLGAVVMHYYRLIHSPPGQGDYLLKNKAGVRFFRNDEKDLADTGQGECRPAGSPGPVLDPNMPLECARN